MTIAITRVIMRFEVGVIYRFTFHSIDREGVRASAVHTSSQGFGDWGNIMKSVASKITTKHGSEERPAG